MLFPLPRNFKGASPRSCERVANELFTVCQSHFGDSFNGLCPEHRPEIEDFYSVNIVEYT